MKNVYICHQYYEPSHFKALYDCAKKYGYKINNLIVLNPKSAVAHREQLIIEKGIQVADEWYYNNFINQGKLWLLKNEIIIIALAPYDRLLAYYQSVLSNNHVIYMTSCTEWASGNVPYPYIDNKRGFIETLTHNIDAVACVSMKTRQEISRWNLKTQIVNHAINVSTYKKKIDKERKGKYIFLGRLVDEKNIGIIVDYLKRFPNKKIEVDVAGDGPLKKDLEKYANRDERFHLLGHLKKNEIKKILNKYDYLILPSCYEPFGIVLLEALACGVPCIISNVPGPMEIITHNKTGIVFRLEDENGFIKAMDYSMELENKMYKEMSNWAIQESGRYDVEEVIKKWILLFEEVTSS